MAELQNRYDFVLLFDVKDGNPNGDPDGGNIPRQDPETGQGLVTDVCLKRKVRNFVTITKGGTAGYDIYVKEKSVLSAQQGLAYEALGLTAAADTAGETTEESANSSGDDAEAAPKEAKDKKAGKGAKGAKAAKPNQSANIDKARAWMCQHFFDVRAFGAVMSLKSNNAGQVRGPVQLTFARSIDPIMPMEYSITRMAVATEKEAVDQGGDNRTMGRKTGIPYGLYLAHGFVSPALAKQTGFSAEDLEVLWQSLRSMFEHDRSASRGLMATQQLIVFKHDSELGNAPAHRLFELVSVKRISSEQVARKYSDYVVSVGTPPAGVTVERYDG